MRLEEILNRRKISTFRFDFFGHGESAGEFENITTSEAVDNVQSAIRFVKESGYDRIGLMGSSFGGFASILTAGQSGDLFVLALKSPVSDYLGLFIARDHDIDIETWRKKGFVFIEAPDEEDLKLNYSFYADTEKIDGYSFAKKIRVPTLIVHGDQDETVPIAQSQMAASLIPDCRLEVIKGADHVYSKPENFEQMLDLISAFIISRGNLLEQSDE